MYILSTVTLIHIYVCICVCALNTYACDMKNLKIRFRLTRMKVDFMVDLMFEFCYPLVFHEGDSL